MIFPLPLHATHGVGQARRLPTTHELGQARCLPAAHEVGQPRRLPTTHGVGQPRAIACPALQSFLRQIPGRRNRYNFTLHQKSRLRWWTCATTPTKWLKFLDGCLRISGGTKPRTNGSNQDLGMSFNKLSITTTNTYPWNYTSTGL
jgi:hypothetical protein